jgi:hypothetical protein
MRWPFLRNTLLLLLSLEIASRFTFGSLAWRAWSLRPLIPGECRAGVDTLVLLMMEPMGSPRGDPDASMLRRFLWQHKLHVWHENGLCVVGAWSYAQGTPPWRLILDGSTKTYFRPGTGEIVRGELGGSWGAWW